MDDFTWLPSVDDTPEEPAASSTEEDGSQPSDPPVVRAVLGYVPHFNRHRRAAQKVARTGLDRVRAAEEIVERLEWQTRGLTAAEENLRDSVKAVRQRFQAFHQQYSAQRPSQKDVIQRIPDFIDKLQQCTLHPLLQRPAKTPEAASEAATAAVTTTNATSTSSMTTLADAVPVERVKAWAQECEAAATAMDRYVSELEESWTSLHEVALEESSIPPLSSSTQDAVKSLLRDLTRTGQEQQDSAESVETEADEGAAHAREAAEEARRQQMEASSGSGRSSSGSAVGEVVFLDKVHQQLSTDTVPSMVEKDRSMMHWLEQLADLAKQQQRHSIRRLRNVAQLQTELHSLQIRGVEVDAAQKVQSAAVADLRHVGALPQSYRSAVAEVIRRRAWGRQYLRRMERMADNLARFRAHEVQRRDAFLREHGPHLPPNLIPGLPERPPHVELRCRVFDDALPAIDSDKELEALLEEDDEKDEQEQEKEQEREKEEGGAAKDAVGVTEEAESGGDADKEGDEGEERGQSRGDESRVSSRRSRSQRRRQRQRRNRSRSRADKSEEASKRVAGRGRKGRPAVSPSSSDVDSAEAHRAAIDKAMEDDEDKKLALESENARLRAKVADLERLLGLVFDPNATGPGSASPPASSSSPGAAMPGTRGLRMPSSSEMHRQAVQLRAQTESHFSSKGAGFVVPRRRSYADVARQAGHDDDGTGGGVRSPSRWGPLRTPSEAALAHVVEAVEGALPHHGEQMSASMPPSTEPTATTTNAAEEGTGLAASGGGGDGGTTSVSASMTDRSKAEAAGLAVVAMASERSRNSVSSDKDAEEGDAAAVGGSQPQTKGSKKQHTAASASAGRGPSQPRYRRSNHALPTAAQLAVQELVAAYKVAARGSDEQSRRVRQLEGMVHHRIAFRGFAVGDVALFLASGYGDDSKPVYTAFNEGAPRRYLSYESLPAFRGRRGQYPTSLVGRIVAMERCVVPEDDVGNLARNPFRLRGGTVFYSLTAERLPPPPAQEEEGMANEREHDEGEEEDQEEHTSGDLRPHRERGRSSSNGGAQRKRKPSKTQRSDSENP